MAREAESGAYLGGISTMLIQSDVCSACGRVHSGRRFGFLGSSKGECPLVVFGSLPSLTRAGDFENGGSPAPPLESGRPKAARETREPPLPAPTVPRRASVLTVPWPMPSNLEDYL